MRQAIPGKPLAQVDLPDRAIQFLDTLGRIDFDNLVEGAEEAGAIANFYGIYHAKAKRAAEVRKLDRDTLAAQIRKAARLSAKSRGEKATDESVKDEVLLNPDWQTVAREYLDLQEKADMLEGVKFVMARVQSAYEAHQNLVSQEVLARRDPTLTLKPRGQ